MDSERNSNVLGSQQSDDSSDRWILWGRAVPKSEIVFFTQAFVIFIVIISAIINISLGTKSDTWLVLLSTSVGAVLPNPKIKNSRPYKSLLYRNRQI